MTQINFHETEFLNFRNAFIRNFDNLKNTENTVILKADVDMDELWNLYLDSFEPGFNEIYRVRREHDCSTDRQVIKHCGNMLFVIEKEGNYEVKTVWDFESPEAMYTPVIKAVDAFVKAAPIASPFYSDRKAIGSLESHALNADGEIETYNHFRVEYPANIVVNPYKIGEYTGEYITHKDVFKRSITELDLESLKLVLDLCETKNIYRGEEKVYDLRRIIALIEKYNALADDKQRELFIWHKAASVSGSVKNYYNNPVAKLAINIDEGMDLDVAVRKYESMMAPTSYMNSRPSIVTASMVKSAEKTLTEDLGLPIQSLVRRFANLSDISINNLLFCNRDASIRVQGAKKAGGLLGLLGMNDDNSGDPRKLSGVREISIKDFVDNVLPKAKNVELYVENRHERNLVSLMAPTVEHANLFKWNNNFSHTYKNDLADSELKQQVKAAGGDVDGVLRFSIMWNDKDRFDGCDNDAHAMTPGGHIFFADKKNYSTGGALDVDIINPSRDKKAVENITFPSLEKLKAGDYEFYVNCFSRHEGTAGFRAEIEFDGRIYSYDYPYALGYKQDVPVATVHYDGRGNLSFKKENLKSTASGGASREMWGIKTNSYVPVTVACYSPNYWDEQDGIGNRHYLFMLKGCVNDEKPVAIKGEYLKHELMAHRKTFAYLENQMRVQDTEDQLSGLGFSSTQNNHFYVRVETSTEAIYKVLVI